MSFVILHLGGRGGTEEERDLEIIGFSLFFVIGGLSVTQGIEL